MIAAERLKREVGIDHLVVGIAVEQLRGLIVEHLSQERRDRLAFVEPLTAQLGKGLGRVGFVEGDETRNPAIAEVSAIEPIQDSGSAQIGKAEHGQSA